MPTATVLGFAYDSPVVEFPVRIGPGTNFDRAPFMAKKGAANLDVLDIQPDSQAEKSDFGRVYNWLHLRFPDGQTGWMRGHVIGIKGDFAAFGYGVVPELTHEYKLTRDMSKGAAAAAPSAPAPAAAPQTSQSAASPFKPQTPQSPESGAKTGAAAASPSDTKPLSSGPATAIIKTTRAVNARTGPSSVGFEVVLQIPPGARVPIHEVKRENRAQQYRWFRVTHEGKEGWVREDFTAYEGDTEALGLPWDLYPAPMKNCWWVRGFNMPPQNDPNEFQHDGWDLGANTGEPILAGPAGGLVVKSFQCWKCTPDRPSTKLQGLSLGDPKVFSDEGWGFGYGHYMIVRYTHDRLPASTQQALAAKGFAGAALFVMYAHLHERLAEANTELQPGQNFATCGNTGNSEATHLHLEVRASASPDFGSWANIRSGVMDPVILFSR